MDEKDIILMKWLAQYDKPTKLTKDIAPVEVSTNLVFFGLTKERNPDSIWVRLRGLQVFGLVQGNGDTWHITDPGRIRVQTAQQKTIEQNYINELQFEKLIKEVWDLDNRLKDYSTTKVVAWIGAIGSIGVLLLELWQWLSR